MAEIITMMRKGNEGNWGLEIVLKKRKRLMRTTPIMNKEITEIDNWLGPYFRPGTSSTAWPS
jgi:hypothetical protein